MSSKLNITADISLSSFALLSGGICLFVMVHIIIVCSFHKKKTSKEALDGLNATTNKDSLRREPANDTSDKKKGTKSGSRHQSGAFALAGDDSPIPGVMKIPTGKTLPMKSLMPLPRKKANTMTSEGIGTENSSSLSDALSHAPFVQLIMNAKAIVQLAIETVSEMGEMDDPLTVDLRKVAELHLSEIEEAWGNVMTTEDLSDIMLFTGFIESKVLVISDLHNTYSTYAAMRQGLICPNQSPKKLPEVMLINQASASREKAIIEEDEEGYSRSSHSRGKKTMHYLQTPQHHYSVGSRKASDFAGQSNLTIRQQGMLEKFKQRVADIRKPDWDDHYFIKWLDAQKFDLVKAEGMLRASMRYREKMGVDEIMVNFEKPEVLKKYFIGGMCGYDKKGFPIRIEPFGSLDMKGIMKSVKKTDLEKVVIQNCEELAQECKYQSEIHQRRIDGFTLIFDMANFNKKMLWKPGYNLYLHNAEILQNNYPGLQQRMFIINAPKIFPILWKISKQFVDKNVKRKIKVLGANYKEELLKYVDKDQLPVYLGGSMTGPNGDPLCSHKICHGGEVPPEYFINESVQNKYMVKVTVDASNELKIECKVPSAGSILSWSFKTEEGQIGFGVTMKTSPDSKEHVVIPTTRVDSHILEQDGSNICEQEGTYFLVFDNSFSWTAAKTLFYQIDVYSNQENQTDTDTSMARNQLPPV